MRCAAPGCPAEGDVTFGVAEDGRFAGRDWQAGDQIILCWPHATDVYSTQGATDPADVAAWLRPDAASPPNTWHPRPGYTLAADGE